MELNRAFRVKFTSPDGQTVIIADGMSGRPGIISGSLHLSKILCTGTVKPGECCSSLFEVDLYNFTRDVTGYTVSLEDMEAGRTAWFTGIVETCSGASHDMCRRIEAYDIMYYVRNTDVLDWFLNYFVGMTAPISIIRFRNDLCAQVGVTVDDAVPALIGDNLKFYNASGYLWPYEWSQAPKSCTFSQLLHDLCVIQNCMPTITKRGKLTFIPLASYDDTSGIYITDNYMRSTTTVSAQELRPFSDIASRIGTWFDEQADEDLKMSTPNLFVTPSSSTALLPILRQILAALQPYEYTPADIDLIVSDPNIELGSWVVITDSVCTESFCKITKHQVLKTEFSGPILVDQHINSPWPQKK